MTTLKLAIQKSGRLSEKSIRLLQSCGIQVSNGTSRLKAAADNFPLEVLYLRDDDIPQYVADGVADIGIVGENVVTEKQKKVTTVEPLGFSKCRLSLAIRREETYQGVAQLAGKKIATSYPVILQAYLQSKGVSAQIEEISGSVEIAPSIGLADSVCDIVSTGSTLLTNGLKEVETVMKSQAVLIATPNLPKEKANLLDQIVFRINAVNRAKKHKYILLNAPNDKLAEISALLPGMNSPTVTPLAREGWSSVHSVMEEDSFWETIEALRQAGAEGILVVPIEKMIV